MSTKTRIVRVLHRQIPETQRIEGHGCRKADSRAKLARALAQLPLPSLDAGLS
jgi:hypothetical protein